MHGQCRFCSADLNHIFVDLGTSPPCESQVTPHSMGNSEAFYPLQVFVCDQCFLVQLPDSLSPTDIFGTGDYPYFSSYSDSWLEHVRKYAEQTTERFGLNSDSSVMEIASNDGYLLQYFHQQGIPVLGIEPASNCAEAAHEKGIESVVEFFGCEVAEKIAIERGKADLLVGNNVLAHVPDINDFVGGMKRLLAHDGVITMEFPHLVKLVAEVQYDTIYHEHYSYLSLLSVETIFAEHGLRVFDVRELPTHGGSLRIYATHTDQNRFPETESLQQLRKTEFDLGLNTLEYYRGFGERVAESKREILDFLIQANQDGKSVVGYGAPGKGNTLLNYCGIRTDMLSYTVDRNPNKQGNFTPGTRIPIFEPSHIMDTQPDYVLILPWNLKTEITHQMKDIAQWGGKFVVPIPRVEVIEP
ncbi:MAG: class I SAM-dependent methyltransferase [Planctomycetota bacterium]